MFLTQQPFFFAFLYCLKSRSFVFCQSCCGESKLFLGETKNVNRKKMKRTLKFSFVIKKVDYYSCTYTEFNFDQLFFYFSFVWSYLGDLFAPVLLYKKNHFLLILGKSKTKSENTKKGALWLFYPSCKSFSPFFLANRISLYIF
jgi:hypothetical protein